MILNDNKKYPFSALGTHETWLPCGSYAEEKGAADDLDLMVEVYVIDDPVTQSDATPKVDRVVLASKILPRLVPDLVPSMAARQALQYADAFMKEIEND
jgi:hypothetical protein